MWAWSISSVEQHVTVSWRITNYTITSCFHVITIGPHHSKAPFPFKRNRLRCVRCVRCVNENRKKTSACVGKQPIMVAAASTEHFYWLALAFLAWNFHATNASASQSACVSCGFRLHNTSDCVWMETGLKSEMTTNRSEQIFWQLQHAIHTNIEHGISVYTETDVVLRWMLLMLLLLLLLLLELMMMMMMMTWCVLCWLCDRLCLGRFTVLYAVQSNTIIEELSLSEWVSSFLTAHQHIKGYFVPSRLLWK